MELSVVIPAFNEAPNISELIRRTKASLGDREVEVIVVDDGSKDETALLAQKEGARVYKHPYNIGNGAAIKTGIRNAEGDVIILMDADLQHPPEEIPSLLKYIDSYDMVIGARSSYRGPLHRRLANSLFNWFASYVTGRQILDLTSGFRVVRANVLKKFIYLLPNGFSSPATLTLAFLKSGRSVKFVPIKDEMRRKGKSKISLFKDGVRFILIITKIATIYSPFRVFLPISLFFFLTGLIYYLYTYLVYHRFTNMGLLLFITSVVIFMLSLIAEQISQLHIKESE